MLEKRGLRLAGAAAAGVLGAQVTSLVMFTSPVAAFQTVTYHYTGAEQFLTVPAGVTTLQVTLIGAPGAAGSTVSGAAGQGGRGAIVTSSLAWGPGRTLYVEVGGPAVGAVGGFNAGGSGGGGDAPGGGGGGASDLRTCSRSSTVCPGGATSLSSRLVVAAGGGGGGSGGASLFCCPQAVAGQRGAGASADNVAVDGASGTADLGGSSGAGGGG
jgi:hypothetical protein